MLKKKKLDLSKTIVFFFFFYAFKTKFSKNH